jgi:hypothetical protein
MVSIVRAKQLLGADANGLSDPFARVTCHARGGELVPSAVVHETGVKAKTLSPYWEEDFVLGGPSATSPFFQGSSAQGRAGGQYCTSQSTQPTNWRTPLITDRPCVAL